MTMIEGDQTVRVNLADRSYDIVIARDLLSRAGGFLAPLTRRSRVFVVADASVAALHAPRLSAGLAAAGLKPVFTEIPPGEASKSMAVLEGVLDNLIRAGAERDDLIVAFGGGVVGDLTGLAAGLLKRGARFVQLPTTLLAQVDSSVGGKTAVNSAAGKNMIGLFHQPVLVLADLAVLDTLPVRERSAGLAEVAKYALIDDPEFFSFLESSAPALRAGETNALSQAVRVSCASKARIVAIDETEQAERALLNLGHTFGHALERANGYRAELLHGEAVGVGMAMAMRFSVEIGRCAASDADRAEALLRSLGLRTRVSELDGGPYPAAELLAHMAHDKKNRDGELTLILSQGIGRAYIHRNAAVGEVRAFLERECAL